MSAEVSKTVNRVGGNSSLDRAAKTAATRAVTAGKLEKLSGPNRHAYKKLLSARGSLETLADNILEGGSASAEVLGICAAIDDAVGKCLFAT